MVVERLNQFAASLFARKRFVLLADIVLAVAAETFLLYVVLHGRDDWPMVRLIAATAVISAAVLLGFRIYRQLWTRVSLRDVVALLYAAVAASVLIALASIIEFGGEAPARVGIGSLMFIAAAWIAPRMLARLWWEAQTSSQSSATSNGPKDGEPVFLYGSGRRAIAFIRANTVDHRYRILGFFHNDPRLKGRSLLGVPGLGRLEDVGAKIVALGPQAAVPRRLVVSEDGEGDNDLSDALEVAAQNGLILCRIPNAGQLLSAGGGESRLEQVSIEDILHRDTVSLANPQLPMALTGKRVLITGAGGSIGSELVRQIATFDPALIVLVEFSEFNLYQIEHELSARFPGVPHATALCDIRQRDALDAVFARHNPELVLHAAALKHVPLLENHPDEAVRTNVRGTLNLAELALAHGVQQFTLVSTDKAVNPTNAMGCTKRWAEMICQSMDRRAEAEGKATRYACVRFGNVLGSAGSVVPLFQKQIAQGGPLTVTDANITRYFMTIPEACELILAATATTIASNARESRVFVLDMGEPVKILDMATRMIQLSGLRPYHDIDIKITGLRQGEKLHEELAHPDEHLSPAGFAGASLAEARSPEFAVVADGVSALMAAAEARDDAAIRAALRGLVPEYVENADAPVLVKV
jgi:FlaA1/EpsC-like NDP-sugar epimerase